MKISKVLKSLILLIVCTFCINMTAFPSCAAYQGLAKGTYKVKTILSCYVPAMGGVEFGAPLLKSSELQVDDAGKCWLTLYLTKSATTIYSVTCDTFIDAAPDTTAADKGVKNGTLGIYDKSGTLITDSVTYKNSSDTAANASGTQVPYVESVTFPLPYESDNYRLTMYVNSNVMGVQFCEGDSSCYPAKLTVDWSSIDKGSTPASAETKTTESTAKAENMDGLNYYPAEKKTEDAGTEDTAANAEPEEKLQYAYDPKLVMIFVGVGIAFILLGGLFLALGSHQPKEQVIVLRLELGRGFIDDEEDEYEDVEDEE